MIPVKFGKWLPDLPFYENPGLVEALNVIPVDGSYKDYVPIATEGDALTNRPQGAYAATNTDGSPDIYTGDDAKLYQRTGTTWTNRSGAAYSTPAIGYWRFIQFDNSIIATNYADAIQYRDITGAANFAVLSVDAPKARQIGVINKFVVVGDTDDPTNGTVPYRTEWCAIGDPTSWPIPGSAAARAAQSGEQFNNSAFGAVTAIGGGQFFGLIFQQRGINRYTYVGGDVVFQIETIDESRGCWSPQSMVQIGRRYYFLAADGFYVTDGQTVSPIGNGSIDKTFFADFDQSFRERMTVAVDYINKVIFWAYPSSLATAGVPDRLIMYNFLEDRWAHAEDAVQLIFTSLSPGYTLEDLDALFTSIDDMTVTLDSSLWTGGIPTLMGFSNKMLGSFAGSSLDARFETGEFSLDGLVWVDSVRPMVTGNPTLIEASIALRENQDNESRSFGAAVARTTRSGVCDFRQQGQFGSVRLDITGGFDRATGLQVEAFPGDAL
jgi:hypothetical protein